MLWEEREYERKRGIGMAEFVLELNGITKTFPGVKALDNVHFRLKPGEIHALMGENGAGKSTFIKIITGVYRPDEGDMLVKVEMRLNVALTRGMFPVMI